MERGSDKHGAMRDEELDKEFRRHARPGEWPPRGLELSLDDADADEAEMLRRQQNLSVAQDHRPGMRLFERFVNGRGMTTRRTG